MSAFKTSLAALGATAALALAPGASAQSYDYADCKRSDKDAQVVGGLVGGLLGAVAGHEIAGRGETTEGAVVGAIAGAAAGAAIGDDRRNCSEEVYGVREADLRRTRTGDAALYDARHDRRGYHRHDRRRNYGHDYGGFRSPYEVRARIERLKNEDRRLKRRAKYRWEPWIERRRDEIRWEVKRLKRIEDRLEDRWERRRDYRDDRYYDRRDYRRDRRGYRDHDYGRRHYHGSTVCYADH